jgi:hypothetical protein
MYFFASLQVKPGKALGDMCEIFATSSAFSHEGYVFPDRTCNMTKVMNTSSSIGRVCYIVEAF